MRIGIISGVLGLTVVLPAHAQKSDSIKSLLLPDVVVTESYQQRQAKKSALAVDVVDQDFLRKHFTGNFMQAMENIPGVQAMDIGSGFSKPMIRGMGFNRIAVLENGIKQEGQQWGADHGLELDAFNIGTVNVLKGPSSLLYGSDAMGGVIAITSPPVPSVDMLFGDVTLLGKSVNGTLGGSFMLGIKKSFWYAQVRYSEQHFGDYRIPTDTIVYLTQKMPVYGRKLKNTAGIERNIGFFAQYQRQRYKANYSVSNVYQKTGFFPGAHGIPDVSRVEDDGDSRNMELPYSKVNHLKVTTLQQYAWEKLVLSGDFGFQNNHREEWSVFHTHYGSQPVPEKDPDKELAFNLNTLSASVKVRFIGSSSWEHALGWDGQHQRNDISGYSFLLPEYYRSTTGLLWITTYKPNNVISVSGGMRYDYGYIHISSHEDAYLADYLRKQGYDEEQVEHYKWNSHAVKKKFGDYSFSLGLVWTPSERHMVKANVGRSFRLPGANELAANGVHHGTFRHEQGDTNLKSEQGWQMDASYNLRYNGFSISVSPFVSWFSNYIFLRPTGEWSVLPHAGQIYRYTGAEALFAGTEATIDIHFLRSFNYRISGEYVYTYNCDEHIPLSFSPPFSMRNTLTWQRKQVMLYAEWQSIARQNRVDRNEDRTPGVNLFHLGGSLNISIRGNQAIEITLTARNIFNTRYYNHLSFYRKVEIPEPGRNFQLLIKIPFKKLL
ncbi:TonB-dependent receptor [Bacteroides caccae]|mgnify:FL=1|jgi:iron complex outermembrane receptor protein|uniref:TonB-dependent receptor n=1 Tax=Bacteroides caccae TaxID=47678 RepID=A0A6A1KAL0_9BACE|nr:TonB-dependent receptor [Bacteroides caccae]KAA5482197.1 TonB-dependent receptor [Bacteroides caccae]KAA5492746.1 TonB-dependent receptor [Bacteroides caccae]KAA5493937.1 TonB-dependent receptor [Bacteroides caccae]KAA5503286.1 TonB-dependent receptor [Bacteroides caccae]MDU3579025.1 TonB-dependent receptor [Bacteroides caccae]